MLQYHHFLIAALLIVGILPVGGQRLHCFGQEWPRWITSAFDAMELDPQDGVLPGSHPFSLFCDKSHPEVTHRLRGRIDTDAICSSQSPANKAAFGVFNDVIGLRRARIGVEGEIGTYGRYVTEMDLASGFVVPRDVYFAVGNRQVFTEAQVGHFREPFSLEGGTSARHFAFMERSPVNLLDPARNWGVGLFQENVNAHSALGLGVFHTGTDTVDFQSGDGSTVGLTGRLTTALVNEVDGKQLLHLGIALSERVPENGVIVINQQPRSPLLDLEDSSTSPFVPVIRIPARFQQLINLQFAAANGPLWTQAEWYGSLIDQTSGRPVFFHGCHFDCGYFITGEHRNYDSSSGTLGAIRVNRPRIHGSATADRSSGWGAWELTSRFAYLDTIDAETPTSPTGMAVGIHLPQSTVGINWYLSDNVRVMLNYSYAVPDEIDAGSSSASILGTRLAVFW